MNRNFVKRWVAIGAAFSVGSLAFLYGCNNDNDDACNVCPHERVIHVHAANGETVERAQATAYEGSDESESGNNDVYYQQHRVDRNFDRDAYLRDRGAYIRIHEGDVFWSDHRAGYERSWGSRRDNRDYQENLNTSVDKRDSGRGVNSVQHANEAGFRNNADTKRNETPANKAQSRDPSTKPDMNKNATENRTNKVDDASPGKAQSREASTEANKSDSRSESHDNKAEDTSSSKAPARDSSTRSNDKN